MRRIKEWFAGIDKDQKIGWGFTIGSSIMLCIAGIFEKKHKDRLTEKRISEEAKTQVANHLKNLMEDSNESTNE